MAVHTDTHSTMPGSTTTMPISRHNMNFERSPIFSRSALTTTDSSALIARLPRLTNDRVKPVSSKSCQTSNTHQDFATKYSRRRSLVKLMPSLSKKKDTSQSQPNDTIDSSPKTSTNNRRQSTSIHTNFSASATRNSNGNESQHQQLRSTENGMSPPPRQQPSGLSRRSSLMKTPRRSPSSIHPTSGTDEVTNSTRNSSKHGSVLNPTVPTAAASSVVPASAQKQKQKQQQKCLSRGGASPTQQVFPQQRRLSLSSAGIVKQNKTETLTPPPSLTKLQNARKTPIGTHPAGTVTSDSGSDGDIAATTMDNQQQIHMKQQHNRAQHSQLQLHTSSRGTNHQRYQQNDPLLQHQRRTSIASLSPLPHPNGVSSSSSSALVRRRSFADISPRSPLAPSASSTLGQHHHHHHHHHQQSDQENKQHQPVLRSSQSHLRHPSWLDSAGFMRPSKCSICHPPPPKKSVITPPDGMGVPKFGLPPPDTAAISGTTATTSTPKYGLERRSSSRNSFVNEKPGRHMYSFGLSSVASTENGKHKNALSFIDGVARMDQGRRLSLPNSGNSAMDYSKVATPTTKRKLGMEKRTSLHNIKGTVTMDHSTRRFSSKRMVAPRTKTGKQLSPDTPILDKDFTHSSSSSSSLTEANTDTTPSSSSNPSPITEDGSRPSTPMDMKHQEAQLMESKYLKTLDDNGYPEAHDVLNGPGLLKLQPSPLPVATSDEFAQCDGKSGLIQHNVCAFEKLQTFLDLSPTTEAAAAYNKNNHQQTSFEIPPASFISEDTSDTAQCTSSSSSSTSASSSSLSAMSLQLEDSSNDMATNVKYQPPTSVALMAPVSPPPPSPPSVLSELEQWTAMVRLTLGRWFTDLNHGHLEHYEKDADGSITTMTITGYVVSMEIDLDHPISSSSSLAEKIQQHRYTLCLGPEERQHAFATMSASSDRWTPDDQVDRCQFKNKSTQCECEFDWMNRRHHCRRCGGIFCKTHSSNRLPLFAKKHPNEIRWSRVCDTCCYDLVGPSLVKI